MADQNDNDAAPPLAWDRIGQFFQDLAYVGQEISDRNTKVWNGVSRNLRGGEYTANSMTSDAARAMTAAMQNLDDLWQVLIRPPERELVATVVPTVFLRFMKVRGKWSMQDPVWIRTPFPDRKNLPAARVYLDGPAAGVKALQAGIRVTLKDNLYCVEVANLRGLVGGFYEGVITAGDRLLANLRVVAEAASE